MKANNTETNYSIPRKKRFLPPSLLLASISLLAVFNTAQAVTDTFNANGTWTAPAGVTSVTVEAWGGGGAGGGATGNPSKGGGGAGGQYSVKVVTVTPGNNYAVVVGSGGTASTGAGGAGGDSTFATNVVVAKGGAGGTNAATNSTGGAAGAGSTTGGVGDTVRAGGSGSAGAIASGACANGGAGGGGAGSGGAGGAASGNTAGTGTATGGGNGGAGTNSAANGNAGAALGGGGGGACAESNTDRSGGAGAVGRVTVTYTLPPTVSSINRASTNPTLSATSIQWTVVFSASVTGVDTTDFSLVESGGAAGSSITSVTGSGTTWTVTANSGTNAGSVGLNLVDNDSIVSGGIPLGGTGAGNGNFTGQVYTVQVPAVSSINRASTNPAYADDTAVSWTVVFSVSVTGVDATDFALVSTGTLSGASITSVTGSGTTWTVTANPGGTGSGTLGLNLVDDDSIVSGSSILGGAGTGNGNFTGQVYTVNAPFCSAPSNVPAGVTVSCVCDRFGRASLNPSTIYGSNWIVSKSDTTAVVPYINATSGYLRLTESTGNNAKAATVPGIFPAAGNYISVEFQHFAYGGSGADGIAVTLSDYSIPAVPGAFGGSLGYAPKDAASCGVAGGCPGFAGGWIGVAIDEFGNYQNPTEGRTGGPGARVDSVGVRGSGSGLTGYNWMAGTTTLSPGIDNAASSTPAPGYYYQVIVDARNDPTSTAVAVNRDTGSGYTSLINIPNVYTAAVAQGFTQATVPTNWQISFTGSTGGSTNIHEIGGLKVCAQTVAPPSGGTASGFNAIDEAYGTPPSGPAVQNFLTGHIYMKVTGQPFKLNVAALDNNQILTTYAASSTKNVTVKLVDNSDGACVLDSTQANYCSATCTAKAAVTGGSQTLAFVSGDSGKKQSANFTINTAYKNLAAVISDGTTTACSTDAFSVRPTGITSVTSTATQSGTSGTPIFKAGTDTFSMTATTAGIVGSPSGYTGVLKVAVPPSTGIQVVSPATNVGSVSPATFPTATSATPSSTATGTTFTYSEVGGFLLKGYNPASDTTSARGVYDGVNTGSECAALTAAQCDALRAATWVGIDSVTSKGDCVQNNYSNTKDANGKYGCSFGLIADTSGFGRFTPSYFDVAATHACSSGSFTYSGQAFATVVITPYSGGGGAINNYRSGSFAKDVTISNAGTTTNFTNNVFLGASAFPGAGTNASSSTVTYTFPIKDTAPATLTLRATDTDSVSSSGHTEASMEVRSGRAVIQNAFGSELVDLAVPMQVQYYQSAANGWVTNSADNCTAVTLAFSNYGGNLNAGETCVQDTGNPGLSGQGCAAAGPSAERFKESPSAGFNGNFNLYLRAPGSGNDGSVDVSTDLSSLSWLRYDWDNNGTADNDPVGRARFGIYRGNPRHIYLRERY